MQAVLHRSFLPAAIALALFGCGDKSTPATPATDSTTTSSYDGTVPADAVLAETQTMVIGNSAEPESLDPHKTSGVPESNIIRQMLIGLTTTDNDGKTIPGMATEWHTDDNKVWTFKIRDANWSNGDPVTAHDFVYSFRRLVDPATASPYSTYLADLTMLNAQDIVDGKQSPDTLGVKAIDDKTLEITLAEPVPYLPDALMHTSVKPVNQKAVAQFGDKWTSPENYVANGPYNLKEWQINEKIVLTRNPTYYDDANTTINEVTLLAVGESSTEVNRYKAGEMDITSGVPEEQFQQLKTELGTQVSVQPKLCTYYYEFNNTKPPFNDPRVRRALTLAMDRETVAEKILGQGQTAAYQLNPTFIQGMNNYTPEWQSWSKEQRIAEAKRLLAEAGYNASNPLSFELLYNTSDSHKKIASAAVSFWKDGLEFIDAKLVNQEWKTYLETKRKQDFEIARAGWCADYNEPSSFLNIFKSGNSQNAGKYNSPTYDAIMLKTLGADIDANGRAELYHQAEAELEKDNPAIFVYHYVGPKLIKPYVAGFSDKDPQDNWQVKYYKVLAH